jgi:PASTA domain-containing protein
MALEKPPLATVEPGRPITAQGWNAIVGALSALYDAVLAFGSGNFQVSVQADGQVVDGVEIVAEPVGDGLPVEGLPLFGSRTTYLVTGVSDGAWHVFVSAPGYADQVIDVTVPVASPVTVNLVRAGVVVPDLFGQAYVSALASMRAAGLEADVVIDALGEEVSRSQVPAEYQNQPVLAQLPAAGAVVDAATTRMRLVVAAAVRDEPIVTMPSLIGLTQGEAATALEKLGLRLGKITVRG